MEALTGDNNVGASPVEKAGQRLTHLTNAALSISSKETWLCIRDPRAPQQAGEQTSVHPAPAEALGEPEQAC